MSNVAITVALDAPIAGPVTFAENNFLAVSAENGPDFVLWAVRLINLRRTEGAPII